MLCQDEQLRKPDCFYEETLTRIGEWPYYRIHSLFLSTAIFFIRTNLQQHEKTKHNENQYYFPQMTNNCQIANFRERIEKKGVAILHVDKRP